MNTTPDNLTSFDLMQMAFGLTAELMDAQGVVDDDLEARIDGWLEASDQKMDRHRYIISEFKARGRQLRDEAARLTDIARKCDRVVDRVKGHARLILEGRVDTLGWDEGRKVITDLGQVYLQRSTKLVVGDEAALLKRHRHDEGLVRVVEKIDRAAITKKLKMGQLASDDVARIVEAVSVVFK